MRTLSKSIFEKGVPVADTAKPKRVYDSEKRGFTSEQELSELGVPLWILTVGVPAGVLVQPLKVVVESATKPTADIGETVLFENWEIYLAGENLALRCEGIVRIDEEFSLELQEAK